MPLAVGRTPLGVAYRSPLGALGRNPGWERISTLEGRRYWLLVHNGELYSGLKVEVSPHVYRYKAVRTTDSDERSWTFLVAGGGYQDYYPIQGGRISAYGYVYMADGPGLVFDDSGERLGGFSNFNPGDPSDVYVNPPGYTHYDSGTCRAYASYGGALYAYASTTLANGDNPPEPDLTPGSDLHSMAGFATLPDYEGVWHSGVRRHGARLSAVPQGNGVEFGGAVYVPWDSGSLFGGIQRSVDGVSYTTVLDRWTPIYPDPYPEWGYGVYALCEFQGTLYAGGYLDGRSAIYTSSNGIAWFPSKAKGLLSNVRYAPHYVYRMAASDSYLWVVACDGAGGYSVWRFDGSVWELSKDFGATVLDDMCIWDDYVYVCGDDDILWRTRSS